MGKIEVRARKVTGTFGIFDHAYMVYSYIDENGVKKKGYRRLSFTRRHYKFTKLQGRGTEFIEGYSDYLDEGDKSHL